MQRWVGKTAVVTGASVGIGAAIAIALAEAGMTVIAAARRLDKLQEVKNKSNGPGEILICRCDMAKEEDINNLMEFAKSEAGGVDVLVNNAAILPTGTLSGCDGNTPTPMNELDEAFKINVLAIVAATRIATADMLQRKVSGHIININSIAGHKIVSSIILPGLSVYPATKYAVTAINELLRLEYSSTASPIRVTSISPGAVDTAMVRLIAGTEGCCQLNPDDIADVVKYVLSLPQSVNITEMTVQATGEMF